MGPSLIQIEHARAFDAERHHPAAPRVRSGFNVRAVLAVALVAFLFPVLAANASARAIDAPGLPTPNVTSSRHVAPVAQSDTTSVPTVALVAGAFGLVIGGALLFDVAGTRRRVTT
jgi:hypothetical protein